MVGHGETRGEAMHEVTDKTARRFFRTVWIRRLYHRAEIEAAEKLPGSGPAVIVSNHGRMDFDFFMLAGLIRRERGRLVRVMVDHLWFMLPGIRRVMRMGGALDGTRENAFRLLEQGEIVLTYPGGVREIMSSRYGHEHIDWRRRAGFAKVALHAGAPVVPVVGVGVNDGCVFVSSGRILGKVILQWMLDLGPAYDDYRDPLTIGLIPLPLPFSVAVHFPLPSKVRYVVGDPILPHDGEPAEALAARAEDAMRRLIAAHGRPVPGR